MKHHLVPPVARDASNESMRPQQPEKLQDIIEDPVAEPMDMRIEQQAAFVPPGKVEPRVLRSQGDQGRT